MEEHAGEVILIVGHTSSMLDVIKALGVDTVLKIEENRFDDCVR